MNVLVVLSGILFLLMILVGGEKGARSFLTLFFNFGVLMITLFFMLNPHTNPMLLTLVTCAVISCINLFLINHVNRKTTIAFLAALITMALMLLFIYIVTKITMIQGFTEDQFEELNPFSRYIGIDFVQIEASVIIMSTIGAVTEIAISITSSMSALLHHQPSISRKDLFLSGLRLGRDILGTDTNTLFFAFYGGYMELFVWFKHFSYSFGEILNSKIFSAEMISIFCAGIGVTLIIPIVSWMNAYFSVKPKDGQRDPSA